MTRAICVTKDERTKERTGERTDGRENGRMRERTDERTDGRENRGTRERTDERTDGRENGPTDKRMVGEMELVDMNLRRGEVDRTGWTGVRTHCYRQTDEKTDGMKYTEGFH